MKKSFDTSEQFENEREAVILQSIGDAVIATDMNGNIILMNRIAENLTGWKSTDAKNQPIMNVLNIINKQTRKAYDNPIISVLKTRKSIKLKPDTILVSRNKKKEYAISDSCAPILDSIGNTMGVVLVFRDITKQKQDEALKEKISADLALRNKDLEQFTAIVSHDLRSPVANILALTALIKEKGSIEDESEFIIDALTKSTKRLDEVIFDLNQILSVGMQIKEIKEPVHFSKLVSDIQESIGKISENEDATFKIDFSRLDEMITIKSYLYSIFHNLISNSIKYRRPNVPLEISIASKLVKDQVILTFSDNGLGINLLKNGNELFGLYKRFHTDIAKGKGMGLYMVKQQVEKLGGTISVKSTVDQVTEFTIVLIP